MRIALVCPYAWDAPGGVQVHVRQLARRLRERGHDVLVIAPARESVSEADVAIVGRTVGISINGSVAPVCLSPASVPRIRSALRTFGPDIIHVHEPLFPGTGLYATLVSPAPVVATFHAYAERGTLYGALAPAVGHVWRRLAARIAVSRAAADFVASRFERDGMRVIPNGAEIETFANAAPARLPPGRPVLFVNRLEPRKGFSVLVDAFPPLVEREPEAMLVVCGDGRERASLSRLPRALRERVVAPGRVPHADLPTYHAASEVFCAPARGNESFGIVLVEAMAAGLPIVASDIAGYREVVRHGREGLLVAPADPEALAGGLAEVLADRDLARRLGRAGEERARSFAWDVVASEVEAVYVEVAGGR